VNTTRVTVAYVRVSTADQSIENQLPDIARLAEARGLKVARVFSENVSAVKHRPEYEALLNLAHSGKIGTIVIWALDRLHLRPPGAVLVSRLRSVVRPSTTGSGASHAEIGLAA